MSVLSTIGSILTGGTATQISADVSNAERYAAIAYFVIVFEMALTILILSQISRKLRK